MAETGNLGVPSRRSFLKAFRPILFWLVVSAVVLTWYYHNKLLRETTVVFDILLEGKRPDVAYTVRLNGQPYQRGTKTRLGPATLVIEGPEIEPIQKKFFVWYRRNDLGEINLALVKGAVQVSANPDPKEIQISGARFNRVLREASATLSGLPVGEYRAVAVYDLFQEERRFRIERNQTDKLEITTAAGFAEITTEPSNANFRLNGVGRPFVNVEGKTPKSFVLPVGQYQLAVWHADYEKKLPLQVGVWSSNRIAVKFDYGQVTIVTIPTGALVRRDYRELGRTPVTLNALKPGSYNFDVELADYLPVRLGVNITGEESITVNTNLVSRRYAAAIKRARQELERQKPNNRVALASIEEALSVTPESAEALQLKGRVESALKDEEAQLAEQKEKKQRELNATRVTTVAKAVAPSPTNAPSNARPTDPEVNPKRTAASSQFAKITETDRDAALFDTHEWSIPTDLMRVRTAVHRTFAELYARWKLPSESRINADTFVFRAVGAFPPSDDPTHCTVLISQVGPNETLVFAKFWEYAVNTKLGLKLPTADTQSKWIPVHPAYYQTNKVEAAELRRKARADSFKRYLQHGLNY